MPSNYVELEFKAIKLRIFHIRQLTRAILFFAKGIEYKNVFFNVGRLSLSDSGSNDHTTKFWCRNRPGETLRDNRQSNAHAQGKFYGIRKFIILKSNE